MTRTPGFHRKKPWCRNSPDVIIIVVVVVFQRKPNFSPGLLSFDPLELSLSGVHEQNSTGDGGFSSLESELRAGSCDGKHSLDGTYIEELLGFIGIYLDQYVK